MAVDRLVLAPWPFGALRLQALAFLDPWRAFIWRAAMADRGRGAVGNRRGLPLGVVMANFGTALLSARS